MLPKSNHLVWLPVTVLGLFMGSVALPAAAQDRPTLNFYGVTGLIDMPSAESQPDGQLSTTVSRFGPVTRTTLSFQISPRLSGSFRYSGVDGLELGGFGPEDTYYDRSFDLRYRFLDEGSLVPAVTLGLQDFIGTGIYAGEYLVATKHLTPSIKVTGGLGWGRLGSYQPIGSPFGPRPVATAATGGQPNVDHWFRGPAAPFAGVEWQLNDRFGVKAEYSSDAYELEDGKGVIDRKSPFSFGMEYQLNETMRFGGYYLYGSEFGVSAQITLDPKKRIAGGVLGAAPTPVALRPARAADPDAWSQDWVTQPDAATILRDNLAKRLAVDGMEIEAFAVSGERAQLRLRNNTIDAGPQAIGRAARAMTRTLPASVEVFEIVPVVLGIPASKIVLRRSDIEALEHAPASSVALRARTVLADAGALPDGAIPGEGLYPRFNWALTPYLRTSLFDPHDPVRADVGLRLAAKYDIAQGFVLSGAVTKKLAGNLDDSTRASTSVLPHVRSEANLYDAKGDPALERLTLAWYSRPGENLYGRVTAGYLERMFGGVSGELLWKPVNSPYALGAELNLVRQRDYDQRFGFQDYDVLTGHVSAYYSFKGGYHAQLDVGRYLAGDVGATMSFDREFGNGWKVGAFATLTDVSFEDFGEGSFDKGIRLEIPLTWLTGRPSRTTYSTTLRPLTRDGGARLDVDGRLYESVRDYHANTLDSQWGRVWR